MALTVINRPAKEIDGSTSTWNAVNLPIQYKLNSDTFPTNQVDLSTASASFANNNGFLEITIAGAVTNVLAGEYVQLTSSNIESFDGIWKVKEKISNTVYVLNVAYSSALLSTIFTKYYNNYFAEVKVFAGLPDWHADYLTNPIIEVGVLRVIPNLDNEIIASFSGIIKADVNTYNQLSEGIELSSFTGFYIQWREGWDQNVSGNIETVYTSWEKDEVTNCGADIVVNGDFATDLSNWTQIDATITSEAFVWNAGLAESNLNTYRKSKIIYQEVNLVANAEYALTVDVTRSNAKSSKFVVYGSNDLVNFFILYSDESTININVAENIVPKSDFKYIGFHFYRAQTPVTTTVTIDNISITPTVCEYLFWGSNSSLQFQNIRGGNMYDHIARDINSKFITNFDTPTIFRGNYYDTSIILDGGQIGDFDISSIADMWLVASDIEQADASSISSWVDRTGNVSVTAPVGFEPTYTISGINGHPTVSFNGSSQFFATDINLSQPLIVYTVFKANVKSNIWDTPNAQRLALFTAFGSGELYLWNGSAGIFNPDPYTLGTNTVVKAVIDGSNSCMFVDNVLVAKGDLGSVPMIDTELGRFSTSYLDGQISEMIVLPADTDNCVLWQTESHLASTYGTYDTDPYGYIQNEYDSNGNSLGTYPTDIAFNDAGMYRIEPTINNEETSKIELQLVSDEVCTLSEVKTINVNNDCSNQSIYLTWLNEAGGWDYWNFTAEKDYGLNIESKDTIKRNVFADWDTDFISGDTELDVINSTAYKEVSVMSQYLTLDEVQAISVLKYSIKVQVIEAGKQTTVIVDSDSITVHKDSEDEDLRTIRFKIRYPNIQVQSQ